MTNAVSLIAAHVCLAFFEVLRRVLYDEEMTHREEEVTNIAHDYAFFVISANSSVRIRTVP